MINHCAVLAVLATPCPHHQAPNGWIALMAVLDASFGAEGLFVPSCHERSEDEI